MRFCVFATEFTDLAVFGAFLRVYHQFSAFSVFGAFFCVSRFSSAFPFSPSLCCLAGPPLCSPLLVPVHRFWSLPVSAYRFSDLLWSVCFLRSLLVLYPLSCAQDVRFSSPRTGFPASVEATFSDLVQSALIHRAPFSPLSTPWMTLHRSSAHLSLRASCRHAYASQAFLVSTEAVPPPSAEGHHWDCGDDES